MRRRTALVCLGSAVLEAAPALAAARAPRKQGPCPKCGGTGRIPCPAHDRRSRRYKPFCSACPEPPCCKGVGWTPCPACADEATREKFARVAALYAKERAGAGFYPWGKQFFCAACEHFRFKAAATHEECHRYHAVAEKALSLFTRVFGEKRVDELCWDEKAHFLIVGSRDQYHDFLDWYYETRHPGANANKKDFLRGGRGVRMITDRLQVLIRAQTEGAKADESMLLHRIAHGAGHLAIENTNVHGKTPAWLGEGWACRSEIEALRKPRVYCIEYVGGGNQPRPPHEWRQTVRDALRRKKLPSFERLFELAIGDMGVVEWSMSISVVSWLVEKFPNKTVRLVDAIKEGRASKAAFEAVFEVELAVVEKAWQRWARTH